jgi:hypothetical protein
MKELNFPPYEFRTRMKEGRKEIFDTVRKKYVLLTPEEWVRQNMIRYLIEQKNYPPSLMAVEHSLTVNDMKKRTDITVFGSKGRPLLIVECKSHTVKIDQRVFDQIARYNLTLMVEYLLVTNGVEHYVCKIDFKGKRYEFLEEIPGFEQINEK